MSKGDTERRRMMGFPELSEALGADNPGEVLLAWRETGKLAALLPEIDRLFGEPQRPEHHPEIDTGIHTMMVVDVAASLTTDRAIRFAALVHDIGKGVTPTELLPSHPGHGEAGARLVEPMVRRLDAPERYGDLGTLAARWHSSIHQIKRLTPEAIAKVFDGIGAHRRPEILEALLIAAEADKRGRKGYEDSVYSQSEQWRRALATCSCRPA